MNNSPFKYHAFGFFDESGKLSKREDIVAFAGFIGLANENALLSGRWGERLKEDGLDYTSMKEALRWEGPFSTWSNMPERRERLLLDLGNIILTSRVMRTCSYVASEDFSALPESEQKIFINPQYCCFEGCIVESLRGRDDFSLSVICDLSEEYAEQCVTLFNKIRARNPLVKNRGLGISFMDDKNSYALQAADMIAYCARAEQLKDRRNESPVVTKLIELFSSRDRVERKFGYKVGSLGLGDGDIMESNEK